MGNKSVVNSFSLSLLASSLLTTSALAGGFDRGGVNVDQLFDKNRFGADAQISYVQPRRSVQNVQRSNNLVVDVTAAGALIQAVNSVGASATNLDEAQAFLDQLIATNNPAAQLIQDGVAAAVGPVAVANPGFSSDRVNQDSSFFVPRFGAKISIGPSTNCLASYSEPYGADNENGTGNALSASAVEFSIETRDYGFTCSHEFGAGTTSLGDSFVSVVGGVSYQEFEGFLARQSFLDFNNVGASSLVGVVPGSNVTNTAGLGTFNVEDEAVGWRAGIAYEIPDIALRAFILYSSSYDYNLTGVQDNTGFGIDDNAPNARSNISLTTEIPQALDIRLQTGIAEGTLAFANLRWQDWSQIDIVPIVGGISALSPSATGGASPTDLAFEAGYRDGYTATVGIGKQLTENLSGLVSFGWDRGTATVSGTQTDSWTLSGGLNYKEGENIEIRIGGAVGVLEGGSSRALPNSIDQANDVTYEFDADLLLAVSAGVKYKF